MSAIKDQELNESIEQRATDDEALPAPYDLEFICATLKLIPINGYSAAINPSAIVDFEAQPNNEWTLTLHGGEQYTLVDEDMAELEETLRQRIEEGKAIAKESMRENIKNQLEIGMEIQNGVQQVQGAIVDSRGRKRWQ